MPRLFLAADHRGFAEKQRMLGNLTAAGNRVPYEVVDLGPVALNPADDFNDPAIAVARAVRENPDSRGVLVCGSAHGIAIQANRFKGVRAICGYTTELTRLGRLHNDANVLCLSADLMTTDEINAAFAAFMSTNFVPEERYIRRNRRLDEEEIYG